MDFSDGTSTNQVNDAVNLLMSKSLQNDFKGVFAVDKVDDLVETCNSCVKKKCRFFWLIYNNQPYYNHGEHWRTMVFYNDRQKNKWFIHIYDSLGADSILNSYPLLFEKIKKFKKDNDLTDNYNDSFKNNELKIFETKVDYNTSQTIEKNNTTTKNEEGYFNDILNILYNSRCKKKRPKIVLKTILSRLQPLDSPLCGLYCLFFIDLAILPISNNIYEIRKDLSIKNTEFLSHSFRLQNFITLLRSTKDGINNDNNIKVIFSRYFENEL